MLKRYLISAAVLAFMAMNLSAARASGGWPIFRDLDLSAVFGTAVPAASPAFADEKATAAPSAVYIFELPVENPAGLKSPIKAADKTRDLAVTAVRKGHGDYEAGLEISGATDSVKVIKLAPGRYLVRGGEVNLTAALDPSGKYFDVSGDLLQPAADSVKFRLNISTDGALAAGEPGFKLELRQDRAAGTINTAVFSKIDAACLVALGLAVNSDRLAPDPYWVAPAAPGPWIRVPYKPGLNGFNPWGQWHGGAYSGSTGAAFSAGSVRSGGGQAGKSKKSASYSEGGGRGGGSRGGGGRSGGARKSSAKARGASARGAGGGGRRGGGDGQFSNGGRRAAGSGAAARKSASARGGAGKAAAKQKPGAGAAGSRKAARADRPKSASSAAKPKPGAAKKKLLTKRQGDSRSLTHNVANSLSGGKLRPFAERKSAAAKPPKAAKPVKTASSALKPQPRLKLNAFKGPGSKLPPQAASQVPPRALAAAPRLPDLRDSLNDAPARNQAVQAPPAAHGKRATVALKHTVTALAQTVAAAVSSFGTAVATVITWIKTLF